MIHRNLLKKVKRANKERKLKLAKENGFDNVEEFIKHLEANLEPEEIKEKLIIHNVTLLDATRSMGGYSRSKYDISRKGILHELENFNSTNEYEIKHHLFEFIDSEHSIKELNTNKPLWSGANGWNTPLWKSIVHIIDKFLDYPKVEKVLIKIYTDGSNNIDYNYLERCAKLIKEVQSNNFTVTFVATEYDLNKIINALDLDKSNTLEIENSAEGFERAFKMSYIATESYATKASKGEDVSTGFYLELQ